MVLILYRYDRLDTVHDRYIHFNFFVWRCELLWTLHTRRRGTFVLGNRSWHLLDQLGWDYLWLFSLLISVCLGNTRVYGVIIIRIAWLSRL